MLEILIREGKGSEPKWVDIKTLRTMTRKSKKKVSIQPSLKDLDGFVEWYNLYDKKCTKKQAKEFWGKKITSDLVATIMDHTKKYIKTREDKSHRLDPIRYLRNEAYYDEIIEYKKPDKKIDITEYKHDTTGMPMGKCEECGERDTYLNQWELYKGSNCCSKKVLPFK